jgi:hypothetical protein
MTDSSTSTAHPRASSEGAETRRRPRNEVSSIRRSRVKDHPDSVKDQVTPLPSSITRNTTLPVPAARTGRKGRKPPGSFIQAEATYRLGA